MLDQMNYQIYPYHINKITSYENINYSSPPYLILKTSKQFSSPLLSSPQLSSPLLSSTLLSLQTSKHSIRLLGHHTNVCITQADISPTLRPTLFIGVLHPKAECFPTNAFLHSTACFIQKLKNPLL